MADNFKKYVLEVFIAILISALGYFFIDRTDQMDARLRNIEVKVSSIDTQLKDIYGNQGNLKAISGNNTISLKILRTELNMLKEEIKEIKDKIN